jgi:uncharacterized protein YecT (DUF1311 family)
MRILGLSTVCALLSAAVLSAAPSAATDPAATDHGAAANREYTAVFSRSNTPCSDLNSTSSSMACMDKELSFIEPRLDAFVDDIRGITLSGEELEALNQTDARWRAYRESACAIPYKRFKDGTIKGPMTAECRWDLDRAYMKELRKIYVLSQFPGSSSLE